jgi:hypothetical protein
VAAATRFGGFGLAAALAVAAPAAGQAAPDDAARIAALARDAGVSVVRFAATVEATVAGRGADGHFRPQGRITVQAGADDLGAKGDFRAKVFSNVDGKGGFIDEGTLTLPSGTLTYKGVFPTKNQPTTVPGILHTVGVQQVTGGTGRYAGATGYLVFDTLLTRRSPQLSAITGTMNGTLFLK